MGRARPALTPPQRSPRTGELFGSCASAGVVGHIHPCVVAITHCHCITPPQQCDLSRHHHRRCCHRHHCRHHCSNQHQGATQRWIQPTTHYCELPAQPICLWMPMQMPAQMPMQMPVQMSMRIPVQMPALSLLFEPRRLIIATCKQFPAHPHSIGAVIGDNVRAPELANTAQLSSGRSHSAVPQIEDGNDGDSRVERACCQRRRAMMNSCHWRLLGVGRAQEGSCLPAPGFRDGGIIMWQKCW